MKKLVNLKGAKALNKKEQIGITGGGNCTQIEIVKDLPIQEGVSIVYQVFALIQIQQESLVKKSNLFNSNGLFLDRPLLLNK